SFLAGGLHCLVWSLGPARFVTSLHPDTLQIIFWGRDWQLGYPKHPPLASWLLNALVHPGAAPIVTVLTLGGVCVAIAAAFIWAAARLYAPPATAAAAVLFYLASPPATFYAIQVNHNSLLIPFWAASLYFALRYFERRESKDALLLGLFAGLGAITKYEILFLLIALAALCAADAGYRPLLRRGASWLAGLIFLAVCAPHLVWLVHHASQSLDYALSTRPIKGAFGLLASLNNVLIGNLVLALGPGLGYFVLRAAGLRPRLTLARWRLCALVALGPSAALILASLAFHQVIRQGWTLPFAPSVALGAALCLDLDRSAPPRRWLPLVAALSVAQLALFFGLLVWRAQTGDPVAAYDLDSRGMAKKTELFWAAHSKAPLRCLIIDNSFISSAPILWLPDRPHVIQLDMPAWSGPRRLRSCLTQGGVAISRPADKPPPNLRLCPGEQNLRVASPLGGKSAGFDLVLAYAPPADDLSACGAP
ncbi:MAG TPA: glycosyltransferase family 39 protein, partial [Beijerinckiaceae bacterium]|nr:glycosyltransferase family 39 protein [Beijerinckiaceae bacterium]